MNLNYSNIFEDSKVPLNGERFDTLLFHNKVTIKRIISSDTIDSEVIIQEEDEWCIMIDGEATILIDKERRVLQSGDYCFIKAKIEHQVLKVKRGSIWLTVHIEG